MEINLSQFSLLELNKLSAALGDKFRGETTSVDYPNIALLKKAIQEQQFTFPNYRKGRELEDKSFENSNFEYGYAEGSDFFFAICPPVEGIHNNYSLLLIFKYNWYKNDCRIDTDLNQGRDYCRNFHDFLPHFDPYELEDDYFPEIFKGDVELLRSDLLAAGLEENLEMLRQYQEFLQTRLEMQN